MDDRLKYTLEKYGTIHLDGWSPRWQWEVVKAAYDAGDVTMEEEGSDAAQYTCVVVRMKNLGAGEPEKDGTSGTPTSGNAPPSRTLP